VSDYIARLHAHPRLLTSIVAVGDGVSLSVKRSDAD
jgi:predicted O-methyltransferase YrrM